MVRESVAMKAEVRDAAMGWVGVQKPEERDGGREVEKEGGLESLWRGAWRTVVV